MGKMNLTSENVQRIFKDCVSYGPDIIPVEGVRMKASFSVKKLATHVNEITEMLEQLPDKSHEGKGDGWTFLNMCIDKSGQQWTDFHTVCDMLVCLGLAIGQLSFVLPRELWKIFPGGMPYIVVFITEKQN